MVRARLRTHLEALKEQFSDLLEGCEIQEFAGTDYTFRILVAKSVWSQVLAGLAEETDYDNFKSEVARHQGRPGAAYEQALHEVLLVAVSAFMVMGRDVSASAVMSCAQLVKIEVICVSKVQGFSRHRVKFNAAAKLTHAR